MKELALHIQDIAENSTRAGASLLEISILESSVNDTVTVLIEDNGCGMDDETMKKALDPFYTTKTVRRVGIGLSLFKQAAIQAAGSFEIDSKPGQGTSVRAIFQRSHVDRQPVGDMAGALVTLIMSNETMDIVYRHHIDDDKFVFDTRVIRMTLEDVSICEPAVLQFIRELVCDRQNLDDEIE